MLQSLFIDNPIITRWMIEFSATNSYGVTGTSGLVFQINNPPSGGSCVVDLNNGIALNTFFTVTCSNWIDSDGAVDSYELLGNFF
jgi:hypothetical protein